MSIGSTVQLPENLNMIPHIICVCTPSFVAHRQSQYFFERSVSDACPESESACGRLPEPAYLTHGSFLALTPDQAPKTAKAVH
jgi:hypothetical protein